MPSPTPDIANRHMQIVGDGHADAALGGAIELGQHDTGDAGGVDEFPRLRHAILSDRRVEDQQHFLRRAAHFARCDAADLFELAHQIDAGVDAARGVDDDRIASFGLAGGNRIEHHRRGIGAVPRANDVDTGAAGPDLELLHGRGAERIRRANQRRRALVLEQIGQLADRGRLAGAVDADDQNDLGPGRDRHRTIDRREHRPNLVLDEVAQARRA